VQTFQPSGIQAVGNVFTSPVFGSNAFVITCAQILAGTVVVVVRIVVVIGIAFTTGGS
jgi:hypothetical protein